MKELVKCINRDTIFLEVIANSQQEVLTFVASQLVEQGVVKPSFPEAIVQREKEFPTGLETLDGGIALPHADPIHVNMKAVAIAVLEKPVLFHTMGPDQSIEVDLLFMLAMSDPHSQIEMLQELAAIFQQKGRLQQMKQASSAEEIIQIIRDAS